MVYLSLTRPTKVTGDYRKTALARAVPCAYFGDNAWWLPPDPDPESARVALKLFPGLAASEPELVAAARLSAADFTPIDLASAHWQETRVDTGTEGVEHDPWQRVLAAMKDL